MATNGPENKGPSIAELQRFVREQTRREFWLVTGKNPQGVLRWFDENCFSLTQDDGGTVTLTKAGVVGYKAVKAGAGKSPAKK